MSLEIRRAVLPDDDPIVEALLRDYTAYLLEHQPEEREAFASKYHESKIPGLMRDLARLHGRPQGELLLAFLDGAPVGCAMMREFGPGVVEAQRIFVRSEARGHGAGKKLTQGLIDRARADGHRLMRLDTGRSLTEAIGLYRKLGFRECPPYHDETPGLAPLLVYFELNL